MKYFPNLSTAFRLLIGLSLGFSLLAWLTTDLNYTEFVDFFDLSIQSIALSLTCVVISGVISAYRWQFLFPDPGKPKFRRLFMVENTGIGLNSIAPIRILAEPVQFSYIAIKDKYDGASVIASLIIGRMIDLTVTLTTIGLGLLLSPTPTKLDDGFWTGIGILSVATLTVIAISLSLDRWKWIQKFPVLINYVNVWKKLFYRPKRLIIILLLTNIKWILLGISAWIISEQMNLEIHIIQLYVMILVINIVGSLLPGLPSGLGPFEFATTVVLGLYGISKEASFAFGLVTHGIFFAPPIIIAIANILIYGPPLLKWGNIYKKTPPDSLKNTKVDNSPLN